MNSRIYCRAGLTLTVTLLAVAWAHAHHGFRAFDRTKPLTLTGVVKSADILASTGPAAASAITASAVLDGGLVRGFIEEVSGGSGLRRVLLSNRQA